MFKPLAIAALLALTGCSDMLAACRTANQVVLAAQVAFNAADEYATNHPTDRKAREHADTLKTALHGVETTRDGICASPVTPPPV